VPWIFLTLGNLLGAHWAYVELGWGGYWGWDPVENASLIPWLFGTVMIHGLHLERSKKRYRRANYVLAWLTYLSFLYGTFLTRSGVLADFSVHSFVDLGISGWLLALMGVFIVLPLTLFALRLREVQTEKNEDPFLSRGNFMVLATITVGVAALVITAGTSAPILTRFMENPGQVGPEFYNRVNLPIALLIAVLLALVPYLTWRGTPPEGLWRKLLFPGIAALVVAGVGFGFGVHDPFHLLFLFLAALALSTNLAKVVSFLWSPREGGSGGGLRFSGLRAAGGYLAHVGVGIILLGVLASSGYDRSAKVTLEQGVPRKVGDLKLTFVRFVPRTREAKEHMEVRVERAGGKAYIARPKLFLNDRTRQLMANPDVHSLALQDLYVSPIEFDPGQPQIELAKGASGQVGNVTVRFLGFDLQAEGNAMAAMSAGKPVTIGADLEVTKGGTTARVKPLYRMNPVDGRVETPSAALPGGGEIYLSGINATAGAVQLAVQGVQSRAKLSVDVTHKPLIVLVWGGLYVVLAGGLLAIASRIRQAMKLDRGEVPAG
jgi:cytochrome c-type biogenesis protein CcmF